MTYTIMKQSDGTVLTIIRDNDKTSIPPCVGNTDYHQYLEWLEDGGEASVVTLPAPVVQSPTDHELLLALASVVEGMV